MKLSLINPEFSGKTFEIQEGINLIGRWDPDDGAYPEIDLEDYDPEAKISRKHAVLDKRGESATIEDLGSLNGTFVNRTERLEKGVRHDLKIGDEIMVGKTLFRFEA